MEGEHVNKVQELKSEGNSAFAAKNYKLAIEKFTEAISITPDYVLFSNRSGAYASNNEYAKALEDAEKCINLKPDWPKGYSRKGLALFHLDRLPEAQKAYEEGLKYDPNNESLKVGLKQVKDNGDQMVDMQITMRLVEIAQHNENIAKYMNEDPSYMKTLIEVLKDIQKNPMNIQSLLMSPMNKSIQEGVFAYFNIRNPKEDTPPSKFQPEKEEPKTVVPELTADEKEALVYKEKGNSYYKSRKFAEALEAYDKALFFTPNEVLIMNNKAAVYMEMGDFQKCIEICQHALDNRYEYNADFMKIAKLYNRMAACYERMKDYNQAIAMYEKSLVEDNNRVTRNALKELEKKRERELKQAYINPEISEKHRESGNELFKAGNFPGAKKEYDEAIKRNPSNTLLYSNRAAALTKLLEFPSALKDCEKALELDPKFFKAWLRKANIHSLMKEYNKALYAYDKGLEIDPNSLECHEGKNQVLVKIQESNRSGDVNEEQLQHAMADPEVQKILRDPQFNLILRDISENPNSLAEYMRDPKVADGIKKLVAAGIIKVA